MARRRRAVKREVPLDSRYGDEAVTQMINMIMRCGKKTVATRAVYGALDFLAEKTQEEPLKAFGAAVDNVKPRLEVKSRRVGGATYQVPIEVTGPRQLSLALRWLIQYAESRKGAPMSKALGMELWDAYQNQGNAIKRRDDTHKMAAANKAFAHYRW